MRTIVNMMVWMTVLAALSVVAQSEPKESATPATTTAATPATLRLEIQKVMAAREAALGALREEYKTVSPADRTALEARSGELAVEYDRAYLTLLVEYHRLTGNTAEMVKAEHMLNALSGEPQEYRAADLPQATGDEHSTKTGVSHEN